MERNEYNITITTVLKCHHNNFITLISFTNPPPIFCGTVKPAEMLFANQKKILSPFLSHRQTYCCQHTIIVEMRTSINTEPLIWWKADNCFKIRIRARDVAN